MLRFKLQINRSEKLVLYSVAFTSFFLAVYLHNLYKSFLVSAFLGLLSIMILYFTKTISSSYVEINDELKVLIVKIYSLNGCNEFRIKYADIKKTGIYDKRSVRIKSLWESDIFIFGLFGADLFKKGIVLDLTQAIEIDVPLVYNPILFFNKEKTYKKIVLYVKNYGLFLEHLKKSLGTK